MLLSIILWFLALVINGLFVYYIVGIGVLSVIIGLILVPVTYLLLFGLLLLIIFVITLFFNKNKDIKKSNPLCYWFTFQINHILCSLVCSIKVKGLDKIPSDGRFLLIFNHRSNWDPMVLMKVLYHKHVFFITKPSNFNIPIAGPMMKKAGFISINRENNKEGLKSILKAIDIISKDVGSIGIAPEGTRNKTLETPLLPFHPGSFKIAFKTECPIVIAKVTNCEKIHKNFPFKRTRVSIEILDTMIYNNYKDKTTVDLSNEIYEMMLDSYRKDK